MRCRRSVCSRYIKLEKRAQEDNDVFRCLECGYIFSPVSHGEPEAKVWVVRKETGTPREKVM